VRGNRLRWLGHVLRKDPDDWVRKCMDYEVDGKRPRGRPEKTWKDLVEKDMVARGLSRGDSIKRGGEQVFMAANGLPLHERGMGP
jgi:hypothetical protein